MITSFYIVSLRWRSPKLVIQNKQETINNLSQYLPKESIEKRLEEITQLMKSECPTYHVDFYIFIFAILCVVCSAIFTFIARSLNISMWCPLLLLLIPTALSFWTSKRRSLFIIKLKQFESSLKKRLYDFSMTDQNITWTLKRVPVHEGPTKSARFCLQIQVAQMIDPELGICIIQDEELPTYTTAIGNTDSINPPSYSEI